MTSQSRAALAISIMLCAYGCATGSDSLFENDTSGGGGNGGTATTTSGTNVGSTSSGSGSGSGSGGNGSGGGSSSSSSSSNASSSSSSNSTSVATTSAVSSGTGIPNVDGGIPGMCTTTADCNVGAGECCIMGLMVCFPDPGFPGACIP